MKTIVLGGTSGIGAAIYSELTKQGHEVIKLSRTTEPPLDLRASQDAIRDAITRAVDTLGGLDALVVAGGMGSYENPIATEEKILQLARTNFIGPVMAYQACLKTFLKQGHGKVLFVSSTVVRKPGASGLSVYAGTKAAIDSYAINEARRVAKRGISINVLSPGWVESPMTEEIKPELKERILKSMPVRRMGTPEEVATFAVAILNQSDFLTGSILEISGGM